MYIFLDESGDIKGKTSYCFIICAFKVGDKKKIEKEYLKWQRNRFPKKLRFQQEIKFTDRLLTEELRLKTIENIIKQDPVIFYTYLKKTNIPYSYRKKGKINETGLLYAEIVGATLDLVLPTSDQEFRVFMDKRNLKGLTHSQFKEILKARVSPKLTANCLPQLEILDSASSKGIQIADWLCGAISRYLENKTNGEEYYAIMKNNIIKEEELFKDYWKNLHNKK